MTMKNLGVMKVDVITLFVEDLAETAAFYREVFEAAVVYEDSVSTVFEFGNMLVNLLQMSEAPGLMAPRPVAGRDAGSRFLLTIRIDDVDAACEILRQRGVVLLNGPIDRPWGVRTISFADPSGHTWELAQQLA